MNSFQLYRILNDYNENQRLYHENIRRIFSHLDNTPPTNPIFSTTPQTTRPRATSFGNITDRIVYYLLRNNSAAVATQETAAPTQQQIAASTENLTYRTAAHRETTCPISLETFQEGEPITRIRHCGHIFRQPDLSRWFSQHSMCPVCRYNIMESPRAAAAATQPRAPQEEDDPPSEEPSADVSSFLSQLMNLFDTSASTMRAGDSGELIFEIPIAYYPITGGLSGAAASVAAEIDAAAAAADLEVD
jgi:hypothetical protein